MDMTGGFPITAFLEAQQDRPGFPAKARLARAHRARRKFERQIGEIFAEAAKGQAPLGAEFERVWDENTDKLYEP